MFRPHFKNEAVSDVSDETASLYLKNEALADGLQMASLEWRPSFGDAECELKGGRVFQPAIILDEHDPDDGPFETAATEEVTFVVLEWTEIQLEWRRHRGNAKALSTSCKVG
ncbi:MAG: hypothetical protein HGB22_02870 [Chlorobiaceae bacterium]|nr:hypothetical protein [Chlorobiaceae bacterium]